MQDLSPNTQAILLLTAPLIVGRGTQKADLLSPGEYKRLARHLLDLQRQPSDLISPEATDVLHACDPIIKEVRLKQLLGRGFLLSQAVERWQTRAIWVVSRADPEYPRRLKARLREDAPAVLYGSGDISLLEAGGLAVVGSRKVNDDLIDYSKAIGRLAAYSGRTIISGGARGVDQAAMRGASESGGKVIGVLAENLEKTVMSRMERNQLRNGSLTLVSAYDPSSGFNIGHAMQRNKLIYALADSSLVVNSDLNKGGTWAGAVEQLEKFNFVPVFIRSTGEPSAGLDGLQRKGALLWPNPESVDSFERVFNVTTSTSEPPLEANPVLCSNGELLLEDDKGAAPDVGIKSPALSSVISDAQPPTPVLEDIPPAVELVVSVPRDDGSVASKQSEPPPAEVLFAAVRVAIQRLLSVPMKDAEVAAALNVSNTQAKAWLKRLVEEGMLEKENKPVRYVNKAQCLFD